VQQRLLTSSELSAAAVVQPISHYFGNACRTATNAAAAALLLLLLLLLLLRV
jgi:MYXO-CTERM domain-containing protein